MLLEKGIGVDEGVDFCLHVHGGVGRAMHDACWRIYPIRGYKGLDGLTIGMERKLPVAVGKVKGCKEACSCKLA